MPVKSLRPAIRHARIDTMSTHFTSYCSHLRRRGLSLRTQETYADCLSTFARWLREHAIQSPAHVSPADLERFRVWLETDYDRHVSAGRQGTYVTALRSFYGWMLAERHLLCNPAKALRYPKLSERIHTDILSPPELARLVDARADAPAQLRDLVAFRLLALSGPRASELCGVDVADVDIENREIVIRRAKGGRHRLAFIDCGTQPVLARYLLQARPALARRDEAALLVRDDGVRMNRHVLGRAVARHTRRLGRHITPHSLRRTFCTLMHRAGANLKVIAELAGHTGLSSTARYTTLDIGALTEVYRSAHPRSGGAQ
jgi:site-specific recombinase XerD